MTKHTTLVFVILLLLPAGGWLWWKSQRPTAHYIEPERVAMPPRWENIITHAPVQFQLGSHHYEVEVEYIVGQPFKGRQFDVSVAWPSMVSYMEGQMIARITHD